MSNVFICLSSLRLSFEIILICRAGRRRQGAKETPNFRVAFIRNIEARVVINVVFLCVSYKICAKKVFSLKEKTISFIMIRKCLLSDLNQQPYKAQILSLLCLPISPSKHKEHSRKMRKHEPLKDSDSFFNVFFENE